MGQQVAEPAPSSPFHRAGSSDRRLKVFTWGDSGVGKTTLALQFPRPVVIDLEGGSDLYGHSFTFERLRTTDADETMAAVDWLCQNNHPYETLVIDPITVLWDAVQRKWSDIFLMRNRQSKGFRFEYFDLGMKEWQTIKADWKEFVRKLIAIDMNVVITARQKTLYSDGALKAIGDTFDGEKSLPYLFDVVVRLYRDEKRRFLGECQKDRSGTLPTGPFEVSYSVFEKCLHARSSSGSGTSNPSGAADGPPQQTPQTETQEV